MHSTEKQLEATDQSISNYTKILTNGSQEDKEIFVPMLKNQNEHRQELYLRLLNQEKYVNSLREDYERQIFINQKNNTLKHMI
jgi:hypothetical protein